MLGAQGDLGDLTLIQALTKRPLMAPLCVKVPLGPSF
jgi:hypothetical protein